MAHRQAADGVVLSVVPLGRRPDLERVERLVLAGLGNRRFLESPEQARQLVEAELHSASRAVARAVRLIDSTGPGRASGRGHRVPASGRTGRRSGARDRAEAWTVA